MQEKNKDFLLFYDWFKIMETMSHKHAHLLLIALVEYQNTGVKPTDLPQKIRDIAFLMFEQIDRREYRRQTGRKGGLARAAAAQKEAGQTDDA